MFGITWPYRLLNIFVVFALLALAFASPVRATETLSRDQLLALQSEAEAAFDRGVQRQAADPVNAKDAFAQAAQKYQLLADAEPHSGPLCFNLANAYLQSGQVGPAIANYLRADKWMPGDERVAAALQAARTLAGTHKAAPAEGLSTDVARWNQSISLGTRIWTGIAAWILVWAALALALLRPSRRWRLIWAPALLLSMLVAASVGYQRYASQGPNQGVVTASEAIVRQGNGEGFGAQFSQPLAAGTEFAVVDRQGDWTKIDLPDGRSGWLNNRDAVIVE